MNEMLLKICVTLGSRAFYREELNFSNRVLNFQRLNFKLNLLNKNSLKKQNILEALQTLKIFSVGISSHIISFCFVLFCFVFFLISRHFRTTQENQSRSIRTKKISCNQEKENVKKEKFLEPIEKSPCFVIITGDPISATIAPFL